MKAIHVPYSFPPDPPGGTEVYVAMLAHALSDLGVHSVVVAPGTVAAEYECDGLEVYRYPVAEAKDVHNLYQDDDIASRGFDSLVRRINPDLVHLHSHTRAVSVHLVRNCKSRGLPVLFTHHTPTVTCQRGTLMLMGNEVCDGYMDVSRCTRCTLKALGVRQPILSPLGSMPKGVGRVVGASGLSGGLWTALSMTNLLHQRHETTRSFLREVDKIVVLSDWAKKVLLINGVPAEKIVLSLHGVVGSPSEHAVSKDRSNTDSSLRLAYFGRLARSKGLHVLVEAILVEKSLKVSLDVYGVAQGNENETYLASLQAQVSDDKRVVMKTPVAAESVVEAMGKYDLVAVPSQGLETGPLVVLEAFSAGVPVIGSRLGGIEDLVAHNVDGILVSPHDSVAAWWQALSNLADDRSTLNRLSDAIEPPRDADAVALEMVSLYRDLLDTKDRLRDPGRRG